MTSCRTLADILASDSQFSAFVDLLETAGFIRELGEPGQLTVFAPTNAAFDGLDRATRSGRQNASFCVTLSC